MPLLSSDSYRPPVWLPNGHLQTIFPALFRKIAPPAYHRERMTTPDDDFLNLDWAYTDGAGNRTHKPPLVILSHGFEGDSTRQYIVGMVRTMVLNGFDCLAWNFRSCGGEMNVQPRFYHSGATDDLDLLVRHAVAKGYGRICLIGFSLGGNLTLKYLGEKGKSLLPLIGKAVVFSVPMDLMACSRHLGLWENRVYQQRFLASLKPKILTKSKHYPHLIDSRHYDRIKSVYDFDDVFTAPLHGFKNAEDYYTQCSAQGFLDQIRVPTLVVTAANDPMVPVQSVPTDRIAGLSAVYLRLTRKGGHCGYRQAGMQGGAYWSELEALAFLKGSGQ